MPKRSGEPPHPDIYTLTHANRTHLQAELERTRIDPHALARQISSQTENKLTAGKVRSLAKGTKSQLPYGQWEALRDFLKDQPDFAKPNRKFAERIAFTQKMRKAFCAELERTNVTMVQIAEVLKPKIPGISKNVLFMLKRSRTQTVDPALWEAVMEWLADRPTDQARDRVQALDGVKRPSEIPAILDGELPSDYCYAGADYVPITPQIWQKLRDEEQRTGIPYSQLYDQLTDIPYGLRKETVRGWIFGRTKSAEPRYLQYILEAYARLPHQSK